MRHRTLPDPDFPDYEWRMHRGSAPQLRYIGHVGTTSSVLLQRRWRHLEEVGPVFRIETPARLATWVHLALDPFDGM